MFKLLNMSSNKTIITTQRPSWHQTCQFRNPISCLEENSRLLGHMILHEMKFIVNQTKSYNQDSGLSNLGFCKRNATGKHVQAEHRGSANHQISKFSLCKQNIHCHSLHITKLRDYQEQINNIKLGRNGESHVCISQWSMELRNIVSEEAE